MATNYQDIIDTIDAAILAWAGEPVTSTVFGRVTTWRSLEELTAARSYYANLLRTRGGSVGFQMHHIQPGGTS